MANEPQDGISLDDLDLGMIDSGSAAISAPGEKQAAAERADAFGRQIDSLKSRQTSRKIGDDFISYETADAQQQKIIDGIIALLDPMDTVRIIGIGAKQLDEMRALNKGIVEDKYGKAIADSGLEIAAFTDELKRFIPDASEIHGSLEDIKLELTEKQKAEAAAREKAEAEAAAAKKRPQQAPQRRGLFDRVLGIAGSVITPGGNQPQTTGPAAPLTEKEAFAARMQAIEVNITEGMKTLDKIKGSLEKADGDLKTNEQNMKASQAKSIELDKKLQLYFAALREFEVRLITGKPSAAPKYGPAGESIAKLSGEEKTAAIKAAFASVKLKDKDDVLLDGRGLNPKVDDIETLYGRYKENGSNLAMKKLNDLMEQLTDVVTAKTDGILLGITDLRQYQQRLFGALRTNGVLMLKFAQSSQDVNTMWQLMLAESKQVQIIRAGMQVTDQIRTAAQIFAQTRLEGMKAVEGARVTMMEDRGEDMERSRNMNDAQGIVRETASGEVAKKFDDVVKQREELAASTSQAGARSSSLRIAEMNAKLKSLRTLSEAMTGKSQPAPDVSIPMPALPEAVPVAPERTAQAPRLLARALPVDEVPGAIAEPPANDTPVPGGRPAVAGGPKDKQRTP